MIYTNKKIKKTISLLPLPSWMRSGHSFPPLRAGLIMYLTRNLTPEASGALQLDQSETMHGRGTVRKKSYFVLIYLN